MIPFALRGFFDRLFADERQRAALAEREEPPSHNISDRPAQLELPARPFRFGERDPLVVVHITSVRGGFGVSKRQLADAGGDRTEALLRRYHGCAYHRIVSREIGSVVNHPLTLRTSHGNAGNRGVGLAIDCGIDEPLAPAFVSACRDALEDLILDMYQEHKEAIAVVPHRAFSAKRRADTSAVAWREVVRPTVDTIALDYGDSVCRIDYELAEGGGRPVPLSWDDRALYDDRGRRLS